MLKNARSAIVAAELVVLIALQGCSGTGTTLPGSPQTTNTAALTSSSTLPVTGSQAAQTQDVVASAALASPPTKTLSTRRTASAGTAEPARSSDAFVDSIGVNTHLWWGAYANSFPAVQTALTNLGVRHIRDGMVWMNWGTGYYDKLNALAAAGIHTTLTTALGQDPAKIATYVAFVPTSLEAIEAPNEPNVNATGTSWVAPIRAFQQSLYSAVRGNPANANVSVVSSAIAYTDSAYATLGDLSSYLDAGNIHDYFGGNAPDSAWISARMAGAAAVSGTKKIVATETGYCSSTAGQAVSESVMAKYAPRAFFEQFNAGVTRTLEYELLDDGTNASDYWSQCGLLHYDYSPKPAYTALKNLIGLLRDQTTVTPRGSLTYTLLGNTAAVHHTLLQKNDGTLYLAMWLNASDFDQTKRVALSVPAQPIAISFGSPVSSLQAYTYDANGNLTPQTIPVTQNSAQISVTDSVTVFRIVPAVAVAAPNVAAVIINPAAHWSFADASGSVATNSVTPAAGASFVGTSAWTTGVFGSAAALTPTTYLQAPAGIIDTSKSYSVSAWLMLADTANAHTAITIEGNQMPAFALAYIPGSGFAFRVNGQDTTWHYTSTRIAQHAVTPVIGTWYHVAATFDKTNCQIGLSVNGVLQGSASGCTAFAAGGVTHFGFGQWQTWSGAIDEVNFYQRVLTPLEITSLAQA